MFTYSGNTFEAPTAIAMLKKLLVLLELLYGEDQSNIFESYSCYIKNWD